MAEYGESSYRRFLQGDPAALEELIRTYSDSLVRFAYGYVRNASVAEDVMEESFAALFVKARRIRDDAHLRAWLYRTVHNKCMDHLRRHRNEVPLSDVENVLSGENTQMDAFRRHRNETVYICIQRLPAQYRDILLLAYFDGFSTEEICRITGKTTKQVYNLHARAKVALKELLQKEGITHEDL
ncbi:MAG: RNA polymerase sigma factor [Firmicutes bacterium]|nr:RNA polymerase sigma factor [Bacillota bacterium]